MNSMNIWHFRILTTVMFLAFIVAAIYSPVGWKTSIKLAIAKTKGEICASWFCFEKATEVVIYTGGKEVHYCEKHVHEASETIPESEGGWVPLISAILTIGALVVAISETVKEGYTTKKVLITYTASAKIFGPYYEKLRKNYIPVDSFLRICISLLIAFFAPWLPALIWG